RSTARSGFPNMTIAALAWAFDTRCPSPAAKLVLLALADAADQDGVCWPSQGRIADRCGLTRQYVNQVLADLAACGMVVVVTRQRPNGSTASCQYRLQMEDHPAPAGKVVSTNLTPPVNPEDTPLSTQKTPLISQKEPTEATPLVKRARARQPFPPDWEPSDQGFAYAANRGNSAEWISREGQRCRDYHASKGNLFADLEAAWRTWVNNAPGFARSNGNGHANGKQSPVTNLYEGAMRAADRLDEIDQQGHRRNGVAASFPLLDSG